MLVYLQFIDDPKERVLFETLYERERARMFNTANMILHNDADAEDAVHEAFIKIAKNMSKISGMGRHKQQKYLVTTVRRKAIDIYRKKANHPVVEPNYDLNSYTFDSYSDGAIAQCILKLPFDYREILLLRFYMDLTYSEISKFLDITQALARKRVERARNQLERICKEEGIDYDF